MYLLQFNHYFNVCCLVYNVSWLFKQYRYSICVMCSVMFTEHASFLTSCCTECIPGTKQCIISLFWVFTAVFALSVSVAKIYIVIFFLSHSFCSHSMNYLFIYIYALCVYKLPHVLPAAFDKMRRFASAAPSISRRSFSSTCPPLSRSR